MKCPKCGATLEGKPEKCPECGVTLKYSPKPAAKQAERKEEVPESKPAQKPAQEEAMLPSEVSVFKRAPLSTNRSAVKFFFLSIITFGIYGIIYFHKFGKELNRIREYYGDKTRISFIGAFFLSFVTLGIAMIVFQVRRICDCYHYARNLKVDSGSAAFYFISVLLLAWTVVCPIIAGCRAIRTMNNLCGALNNL